MIPAAQTEGKTRGWLKHSVTPFLLPDRIARPNPEIKLVAALPFPADEIFRRSAPYWNSSSSQRCISAVQAAL